MKNRIISILMGIGFVIFMFMMLLLWALPFGGLLVAFIITQLSRPTVQEDKIL